MVAAVALAASGCARPFLRADSKAPDPKPSNALVAGFTVRFVDTSTENKSVVEAASDIAQNSQLADFGKRAAEMYAQALAQHGYTVMYDRSRATELDAIKLESSSTASALTGVWRHPDASLWTPETVDGLFVHPQDVIGKVRAADGKEYFAFGEVRIQNTGWFFKEPLVVVRASIYDRDAHKVLDLQGVGSGDTQFFIANRSPQNLELALKRGFESLATVKTEEL